MPSSMLSFRRNQFASASPPIAGSYLQSKSGKSLLRVGKVTTFRRSGEPVGRDTIRMTVDRLPCHAAPQDCIVLPWPIRGPRPVRAVEPPAVRRFHQAAAAATSTVGQAKSRKQKRRDFARDAQAFRDDQDSVVPRAQRVAVMAADGSVFAPPKVTSGSWRDPEQAVNTRSPKMTSGFRRTDPLAVLAKGNSNITVQHITAADFYRMSWERGPGGAFPGGRELTYSDRQFSPSTGPAEFRCEAMRVWIEVQGKLPPKARSCLEYVVLSRISVSSWAVAFGGDRRYAVGYLVSVLDQLLMIFQDDVESYLRQERVVLD